MIITTQQYNSVVNGLRTQLELGRQMQTELANEVNELKSRLNMAREQIEFGNSLISIQAQKLNAKAQKPAAKKGKSK